MNHCYTILVTQAVNLVFITANLDMSASADSANLAHPAISTASKAITASAISASLALRVTNSASKASNASAGSASIQPRVAEESQRRGKEARSCFTKSLNESCLNFVCKSTYFDV